MQRHHDSYREINEPPIKRRRLDPLPQPRPQQYHQKIKKRKSPAGEWHPGSCIQEMKKTNISEYWSGRTTQKDIYDFLIISSLPNCIHRYIK